MATPATPLPPPPGTGPAAGGAMAPTSPIAASPAPETKSPEMERASRSVIEVVQRLRSIAQAFPGAAPIVSQINDLMRELQLKVMAQAQPSEPAAPPFAG